MKALPTVTPEEFAEAVDWANANCPLPHIILDYPTLMYLIGQVQLAMRHPQNTGPSVPIVRGLIEKITDEFLGVHWALKATAEMGWDESYDVEAEVQVENIKTELDFDFDDITPPGQTPNARQAAILLLKSLLADREGATDELITEVIEALKCEQLKSYETPIRQS